MGHDVELRGFAIAFDQCGWVGSDAEIMDAHAFDVQVADRSPQVFINFNSHDDPPLSKEVSLFTDSYGLGFRAKVDSQEWMWMSQPMRKSYCMCSINMTRRIAEPNRLTNGSPAERVVAAEINHICITDSPAHPGTGVWAIINGEPPARFRELNQQWRKGWNSFVLAKRRKLISVRALPQRPIKTSPAAAVVEIRAARRHAQRLAGLRARGLLPAAGRRLEMK
jgi:hypothetical protein